LIRVVQHGGLRGAGGTRIVVGRNRMKEFRARGGFECDRALFDEAKAEMDVTEQAPLVRLPECGTCGELGGTADVVEECRRQQQVSAKARMQLRGLPADGRHADRVLEQTAGVRVMRVCGGQASQRLPDIPVVEEPRNDPAQARMGDLACQELEETVQLVGIASHCGSERAWIRFGGGLQRSYVELKMVTETLDPSEDSYGIALGEARVEQLDVVPHARLDAAARIDKLESEVSSAPARAETLLPRDRIDALDHPLLGQLRDRAHA
jgi:hypothetical protein